LKGLSLLFYFFLFLPTGYIYSQALNGVVKDQDGNPIPYVHVYSKEGSTGTYSDRNGLFVLDFQKEVFNDSVTIIFSHVQYYGDTLVIGQSQKNILIVLEEVVVTLIPYSLESTKLKKHTKAGYYRESRLAGNFAFAVYEQDRSYLKIELQPPNTPEQAFVNGIFVGFEAFRTVSIEDQSFIFIAELRDALTDTLLNKNIIILRAYESNLPGSFFLLDDIVKVPNNGINLFLEFIGFENAQSGKITRGSVVIKSAHSFSDSPVVFQRRNKFTSWHNSDKLFEKSALNIWLDLIY
jgi:hypothetical protein